MSSIAVTGASKRYVKYRDTPLLVNGVFGLHNRERREELWALRDIDFTVEPGESVGVIGRNGSGKSTLLRMLAGVSAPTTGRITVRGSVAPLIAVGVGFHPELTGRENVFVSGAVLGLPRRTIEDRFDDIVEFADIGDFLDTPVKFYSSGMFVRLGFAVSVVAEPDVLLIDEVLAVGDMGFQLKCFDRMEELRASGATVVLVSHNLTAVRHLCARTLLIDDGRVAFDGETTEAISRFQNLLASGTSAEGDQVPAEVETFTVSGPDGEPTGYVEAGTVVDARLRVRWNEERDTALVHVRIHNARGELVYADTDRDTADRPFAAGEETTVTAQFALQVPTGDYLIELYLADRLGVPLCPIPPAARVHVGGRPMVMGATDLLGRFEVS